MKKKGFTLIELLAVIVILAIIALVSVPIILNMIESAKKSGAKSSAYGYIEAIEYNNGLSEIENSGYIKIEDGIKEVNSIIGLKMKGKAPEFGEVNIEKGKVKSATLCINGYEVKYKNKDATITGKCDVSNIIKLEKISVTEDKIILDIDGTYQIEPIFEPENATYKNVSYEINDKNIATISSNGVITGKKLGKTTLTIKGSNNKSLTIVITVKEILCKRATILHTEECKNTSKDYYCSNAGYKEDGSKDTKIITYGNLGTKGTLTSGDAFDCDVNGDKKYDPETERFYYVSDYYNTKTKQFENDTATLIYYNNTNKGVADNTTASYVRLSSSNYYDLGPVPVMKNLPTTTQWSNINLKNNKRDILTHHDGSKCINDSCSYPTNYSYEGYAARLLTYQELIKACSNPESSKSLDNCIYLLENTTYSTNNERIHGYWLETANYNGNESGWEVRAELRKSDTDYVYRNNTCAARPVIDVSKTDMYY